MILQLYKYVNKSYEPLPFYLSSVKAGFPSPADDFVENRLDLNTYLVKHPAATFYVRVSGDSMVNAAIMNGDILIVDRSLKAVHDSIIIAVLDGEFTVKRLKKIKNDIYLMPENPNYRPIKIFDHNSFEVWGVVTYVIHSFNVSA